MSSEVGRFVLSSLANADRGGRHRLHSRSFCLYTRAFALLLVVGACQVMRYEAAPAAQRGTLSAIGESTLHVLALLAVATYLWFRSKQVFATPAGLEVGSGKRLRVVPWSRVVDVREVPWIRFSLSWYPRMWQVDLDRNQRFDFCGTRRARDIVRQYVARAERVRDPELP